MKSLRNLLFLIVVAALCVTPVYPVNAAAATAAVPIPTTAPGTTIPAVALPAATLEVAVAQSSPKVSEQPVTEPLMSPPLVPIPGRTATSPQTGIVGSDVTIFGPSGATVGVGTTGAGTTTAGSAAGAGSSPAATIAPSVPATGTTGGAGPEANETPLTEEEIIEAKIYAIVEDTGENTEQFLVQVTKPVTNETVFKESYSICGIRDSAVDPKEEIVVYLLRYDSETGSYEFFEDIDGDYVWEISSNGVFTKNVILDEGDNKFAVAAYKASLGDTFTGEDVQVTMFNITYKGQETLDKINEKLKGLTISSIFKEIENKDTLPVK